MAGLMRFRGDPVTAGLTALAEGRPIVTDIRMVSVGIQRKGHGCPVHCALDRGAALAQERGITRASAGLLCSRDLLTGAIVVIGNAPSALLTLCTLLDEGTLPALVIGTPVGFVNAAESKERLRAMPVPSISNDGTRGGTPVAVAAMNELITMFSEGQHD
jgi:precorrin-8X/cobalt-precorrin-8 methylmutase